MAQDPATVLEACRFLPPNADPGYLRSLLEASTNSDPLVMRAVDLAGMAHSRHRRDEGDPYIVHPLRVALTICGADPDVRGEVVAAALCHDVLEDAPSYGAQVSRLGAATYGLVSALTNDWFDDIDYYAGIVESGPVACRLKLADRIDNLRFLHLTDPYKQARYLRSTRRNFNPLVEVAESPALAQAIRELADWHEERIHADLA